MADILQTVANLVGYLVALVGVIGAGAFTWGAYLYMAAAGSPQQMERGKTAMFSAIAGVVLVMIAYAVVNLVVNAAVNPGGGITPTLPVPANATSP